MALLNYNRALLTNTTRSISIPLTTSDTTLLEFGLFVPNGTNFIELIATIGWTVPDPVDPRQPTIILTIEQDNIPIASVREESVPDGEDSTLDMVTTFQPVLTNVPVGHHVYKLRARADSDPSVEGTVVVSGPAVISGKVIVNS